MNDKKRLNAEDSHKIKQGDINAWKRGKDDAKRNQMMKTAQAVGVTKAVNIVKLFAQSGDPHFISMKLQTTVEDVRKVLDSFQIKSIEDARSLINSGIIAELDSAKADDLLNDAHAKRDGDLANADKLAKHEEAFAKPKLSPEERDLKLRDAREEAFRKNKADRIKDLISQGIDRNQKTSDFQIEVQDISTFKSMIPHGVSQLQRRFGGSKKDIVQEIKRLSPTTDIDMLRP